MKKMSLIVFSILCISSIYAKEEEVSTKLEAFTAKTGMVLIKGYSEIGSINGKYRETISIDAKDFTNPSNLKVHSSGITITIKESGRLEREAVGFIDYDEIDSLISGIDYISKATKSVTYLESFEATYKTKGDLQITVFSDSNNDLSAVVAINRVGNIRAFIDLQDLARLRELIINAKAKLKQ